MAERREEAGEEDPDRRQQLDEVRSALRRLGYLNDGFERFLLQDALRGQRPLRTLARLTLKVGLLSGLALAFGLALALAAVNGSFATPLDLPVLFLHLFAPITLASSAAFLALCGLLLLVLRLYPVRHIETLSLAAAAVAGAAGLALALWGARGVLAESSRAQLALVALAAPVGAYMLVKLVHNGLLALAIRFTDLPPRRRVLPRRWMGAAILGVLFLLLLPVMLSARRRTLPPPESLPVAPGERVLLLGLDGVLPEEVEYLLARGELPALGRLAAAGGGGRLASYRRRSEPPAAFWTSVATGVGSARHGVAALDSFLPLGTRTQLARSGPLRAYFRRVEVPLGLAEYRPLLASHRRAFTFWELAARGGVPVLAVDWWATYPVDPVPGLVVAHDAYHLLAARASGAVSPESAAKTLLARLQASQAAGRRLRGQGPPFSGGGQGPPFSGGGQVPLFPGGGQGPLFPGGGQGLPLPNGGQGPSIPNGGQGPPFSGGGNALVRDIAAALPAPAAAALLERAVLPDIFYRETFAAGLSGGGPAPRAAALYLPGLDIAAGGWRGGDLAFADLVRDELAAADRLLERALAGDGFATVAVVFDPGRRREGGSGRVLLWRRAGCRSLPRAVAPEAVAAGLLRALGLPQSLELPPPPAGCAWPAPPATVAGFGEPGRRQAGPEQGSEYLEDLKSLGYL